MKLKELAEPFPPERVHYRVGATNGDKTKGLALAYIDARDVMDRLDAVCGPENWQRRYAHVGDVTVCEVGILIGDKWIWKADGAGKTDVEAEKGILSDAFKRAAVNWGVGRYLYDSEANWVDIEQRGRSYVITKQALQWLQSPKSGAKPRADKKDSPQSKGGHARAEALSEEERKAIAQKAAAARWDKEKDEGKGEEKTASWAIAHNGNWIAWLAKIDEKVTKAPDLDALTKLQMDNAENLKAFGDIDQGKHAALMEHFTQRMGDLLQGPTQ